MVNWNHSIPFARPFPSFTYHPLIPSVLFPSCPEATVNPFLLPFHLCIFSEITWAILGESKPGLGNVIYSGLKTNKRSWTLFFYYTKVKISGVERILWHDVYTALSLPTLIAESRSSRSRMKSFPLSQGFCSRSRGKSSFSRRSLVPMTATRQYRSLSGTTISVAAFCLAEVFASCSNTRDTT